MKAFDANYKEVTVKTNNLDSFKVIKNFPQNVPQEVADLTR